MNHFRHFCTHCHRYTFLCAACGNNTCNGGVGERDGKPCTHCEEAYIQWLCTPLTTYERMVELAYNPPAPVSYLIESFRKFRKK